MALTNMSISFSKSEQQVSLLADEQLSANVSANASSNSSAVTTPHSDSTRLSSEESLSYDPEPRPASSTIDEVTFNEEAVPHDDDKDVSSAEQAEEAIDLLAQPSACDTKSNSSDSSLWPAIWSPTTLSVAALISAFILTRFTVDFLLGALTALLLSPVLLYLVIRYYFLRDANANFDDPTSENYLDTATRTDNEMSGWMYSKELNEKKAVYVRLRGRQLKLSYKDSTSRVIELTSKTRLQLVSPYTKSKKRLKHLFNKNLPLVITVEKDERLVLFFREAKQKETWFWAMYPLFYPYDAEHDSYQKLNVKNKLNYNAEVHDWFNLILSRAFRDLLSHYKWRR